MFRLSRAVRRGSGANYPAAWIRYDTLEAARDGAVTLLREARLADVMIVRDGLEQEFVEGRSR